MEGFHCIDDGDEHDHDDDDDGDGDEDQDHAEENWTSQSRKKMSLMMVNDFIANSNIWCKS